MKVLSIDCQDFFNKNECKYLFKDTYTCGSEKYSVSYATKICNPNRVVFELIFIKKNLTDPVI